MTRHLCSEADAAWKKMHEVMYNNQLEYDWQLSDFLKEAEATLANMRDQIWTAICTLVESQGVTFEDCLSLMLRILPLLLQIPVDILYETQIPLTITYCPESLVYRRWHPEQGGVSPFFKEVRALRTLTKVLGGAHHQDSEGMDCAPSPTASEGSVGSGRSWDSQAWSHSHSQSITSHHSWRSGSAQSRTTKDDKESSNGSEPSHVEEDAPHDDEYVEISGGDAEVLSDGQVASDGDEGPGHSPIRNTLSSVSHVFGTHEEMDVESDHEEKTPPTWQKQCQPSPKEETSSKEFEESSSEEEQPADEALRDKGRQQAQHLDTNFDAWQCRKIAKGLLGWVTRDTMICDLPKHGKAQLNHLDLVGLPLEYMRDHQVFEGIQLDIYDLCQFYMLGMMGGPPEFPTPQEPVTHGQVQDLLKLARTIGRPYLILVHSMDSVMAVSLLRELHTAACLRWLQVNLWDKLVKLSFCSFCTYLNHIIITHYNASYGCGRCLKQAFISSSALHTHKKVCLGFPSKKLTGIPDGKPKSGGGNSSHRGSSKATPKKDGKGATANSQGLSAPQPLRLHHATVDRGTLTTTGPRRMMGKSGKRQPM